MSKYECNLEVKPNTRSLTIKTLKIRDTEQNKSYNFDFLPEEVDYETGVYESQKNDYRRNKLEIASPNIWQVGWYIPSNRPYAKNDFLTQTILKNKNSVSAPESSELLGYAMLYKAKKYDFQIFDVDYVIPVPNYNTMECTKAVSIGKALSSHLASDHNDNPKKNNKKNEFQNCLKKIVDIKTKNMNTKEKQNFYDKNRIYEFN